MKTIKKMLVFVILFTIATAYPNEMCANVPNKVVMILKFSNVKKGHRYTIKDHQGSVLYSEIIERNGTYSKEFDFTDLGDGLYAFEVSKDFEIITRPFKIVSKKVSFLEDLVTKEFKPVIRVKNNTIMVSHLSLESKPLKVELFYEGELIYSDELKGGQVLKRIYKLSNEEKGDYYLSLKSGYRVFTERFSI